MKTALKLRNFAYCELYIEHHNKFGNVHRFGKVGRHGARSIVARFIFRRDFECVLHNAYHLKGKPFGINEQLLAVIEACRRKLYPAMKQAKREGKIVSMVRDKLLSMGNFTHHQKIVKQLNKTE